MIQMLLDATRKIHNLKLVSILNARLIEKKYDGGMQTPLEFDWIRLEFSG